MIEIGGYTLTTEFATAGGGQCRWAFAKRGGADYFIKEFLSPTYPLPDSPGSPATKAKKLARCEEFESHQRGIMKSLDGLAKHGGNLVAAKEFFRFGARYYKVTEKIDISSLSVGEVHTVTPKQQLVIAGTVAHSLQILHRLDLVHGDIKPPNVLLKETGKSLFAAKLIDFDSAYFSQKPPAVADMVGDVVYYAPEVHQYVQGEGDAENLRCSADIYSLGVLFAEYFTGTRPSFVDSETCAVGALNGATCTTGLETEWPAMQLLVESMMQLDLTRRPQIGEVIASLKSIKVRGSAAPSPAEPSSGPRLRGLGLKPGPGTTSSAGSVDEGAGTGKPRLRGSLVAKSTEELPADDSSKGSRLSGSLLRKKGTET